MKTADDYPRWYPPVRAALWVIAGGAPIVGAIVGHMRPDVSPLLVGVLIPSVVGLSLGLLIGVCEIVFEIKRFQRRWPRSGW